MFKWKNWNSIEKTISHLRLNKKETDMVTDMVTDIITDMVTDMVTNKVTDMVTSMVTWCDEQVVVSPQSQGYTMFWHSIHFIVEVKTTTTLGSRGGWYVLRIVISFFFIIIISITITINVQWF